MSDETGRDFAALVRHEARKVAVSEAYWKAALSEHDCATCSDCIHDGHKCCGCYDGVCCQGRAS